jgi:hypothetical protein
VQGNRQPRTTRELCEPRAAREKLTALVRELNDQLQRLFQEKDSAGEPAELNQAHIASNR